MASNNIRLLIDGYNLLFQTDLVGSNRSAGWIEQARSRLLSHLDQHLESDLAANCLVVFDSTRGTGIQTDFHTNSGVSVRFSRGYDEADDLLEELITKNAHPKQLWVVSSDHRIQRRARARKAKPQDADLFWEQLLSQSTRRPDQTGNADRTPSNASRDNARSAKDEPDLPKEEIDYWMKRFSDPPDTD